MDYLKKALELKTKVVREYYISHFPDAKRKQSIKTIKQIWAGMYRWTLDNSPCQVGFVEYHFWSSIGLDEFTELFRSVEKIELDKRNGRAN